MICEDWDGVPTHLPKMNGEGFLTFVAHDRSHVVVLTWDAERMIGLKLRPPEALAVGRGLQKYARECR